MAALLEALAASSRHWIGDAPTGAMVSAMRAFMSAATGDDTLVREAAASLPTREAGSAAFIAVALGSLVERGTSAEITGPALFEALRAWLPQLPFPDDEDSSVVPTPDEAMRLARFQFLCQSVVTHLARWPARREAMARDRALLDRLEALRACSHGAWWVHEALVKVSGTLVVLHAPGVTGLRLRFVNVSIGYQLFSLLQTAVGDRLPGGRAPDDIGARGVRGQSPEVVTDRAWWHYGSPRSRKPDPVAGVRGESLVRDLERVDGEPVLLLWPLIGAAPTWSSAFLGPHLEAMPADASVERVLTAEEARAWLDRLVPGRQRKRWWPF
jgi:hypothetical protein